MKKIFVKLIDIFNEIREESFLGYDTISFLMTLFGAIFGAVLIALVVLGVTSLICFFISCLFLWVGFETIADKISLIPFLITILTLLASCVLLGASFGVEQYKNTTQIKMKK